MKIEIDGNSLEVSIEELDDFRYIAKEDDEITRYAMLEKLLAHLKGKGDNKTPHKRGDGLG